MFEIPRQLERDIRVEWLRVLDSAGPSYDLDLFADEDKKFIAREVARRLYEPTLPNGGAREKQWIDRLQKMSRERDWDGSWKAGLLAQKFIGMHGRYYERKPMTPKNNKAEFNWAKEMMEAARAAKNYERHWFYKMWLAGQPEAVSDFRLDCLYLVEKPDGNMDRLIRMVNVSGEKTGLIPLNSLAFHAPTKFREFALSKGNFTWAGGEKQLQNLMEDVNRSVAWKRVKQIVSFGWHALGKKPGPDGLVPGIWFSDEGAIADGKIILPRRDESGNVRDGIIWHDDHGYIIEENAREGKFLQGRPSLRLEEAISLEKLKALFRETCTRLKDTLGKEDDFAGFLVMGAVLAYAAAPEIIRQRDSFASLWLHGLKGSGKTTLARVLMALHGLRRQSGLDLNSKQVTAIGLAQALEQYSNLMVWADEFRQWSITDDKLTLIRSGYDRTTAAKWSPDGVQRQVNTNFLVSGETTSNDAATASRYAHVQVSATEWQGMPDEIRERVDWFNRHRDEMCFIFRHALLHRGAYVSRVLSLMGEWELRPELQSVDARVREVYGTAWAGWMAFNELVKGFHETTKGHFTDWLSKHVQGAAADVTSDMAINMFWQDLVTAFKAKAIPNSCFRINHTTLEHPPGCTNKNDHGNYVQGRWNSYSLFIDPEQTLSNLKIYLRKSNEAPLLRRSDLQKQLSKQSYWLPGKNQKRFGKSSIKGWGIEVDAHPLGYQQITDDEAISDALAGEDPRKGPLFEIIAAIIGDEGHPDGARRIA